MVNAIGVCELFSITVLSFDLLLRSLRRALNKDEISRRIVPPPQPDTEEDFTDIGPLYSSQAEVDDCASGAILVARSRNRSRFGVKIL